jgi:serine/threonine protein kinase/sugar lactone lactonase YvrE
MNTGDWLGRYKIVRKIGEGGMGEVFLADDPKLNRPIAVKILSADFAADSDRMMRFVHEAISASALNHPNIITIYEINDENDIPFIAMEFVEGETLGRRMKSSGLEIHETLDIAIQVATALAAAHEASVVHRDIKPDNVILRPDGLVKVLDFGLAKQVESTTASDFEAQIIPNVQTHPGLVMGTVAYMSPEQARGKLVDARSDIFSFGSMLYQMVSGRLPFVGENDIDVVGSILHKEPRSLSQSARTIPHDVEGLIKKSLRKNRDERYQTMRELLADLKEIREELRLNSKNSNGNGNGNGNSGSRLNDFERGMPTEKMNAADVHSTDELSMAPSTLSGILISEIKAHPVKSLGLSVLIAAALAGLLYGAYRFSDSFRRPESFQTMRFEKLTFSGNVAAEQAAVSPDGKYFAYVTQEAGEQSLWVKQTATDSNVQIVPPSANRYNGLTFSPDANRVYFTVIEKEGTSSLYQVPALGGPARRLATDAKGPVAFSPDGRSIVFVRSQTSLIIANADGTMPRTIAKAADGKHWLRMAWSPDGSTIAATTFSPKDSNDHLVQVSVADGTEKPVSSPPWLRLRGVSWLSDGSLVVSGRDPDTQYSQIWIVDPANGTRRRLTNDLNNYQGLSMTSDGRTIVSTQQNILSNIWAADASAQKAAKITSEIGKSDGMSGIAAAPDGKIIYTTRIKGTQDLWIINGDGSGNRQLTFDAGSNFSPSVSPDGRHIIFVSTRGGDLSLWRMNFDGSDPVQITSDPGSEIDPVVSPDGKWVVYQITDGNNRSTIWKTGIDGGQPVQLTTVASGNPAVSPDGKFIACNYGTASQDSAVKIAIIPIDGSDPVRTIDSPAMVRSRSLRWSADGRSLVYVDGKNQVDNLWSQPIDGGTARQLTEFTSDRIFRFDSSVISGRYVFARGTDTSDAVMISDFR